MQHPNCGGIFKVIHRASDKVVYQCNHCGRILVVYIRTATGGNQEPNLAA